MMQLSGMPEAALRFGSVPMDTARLRSQGKSRLASATQRGYDMDVVPSASQGQQQDVASCVVAWMPQSYTGWRSALGITRSGRLQALPVIKAYR